MKVFQLIIYKIKINNNTDGNNLTIFVMTTYKANGMNRIVSMLLLTFCGVVASYCQNKEIVREVVGYTRSYPQEKIYVHTDKPYYAAGDTIWFRVYLADAVTNENVRRSRYVYVELLDNKADTMMQRAMVQCDSDGVYSNAIILPREMRSGKYTLAAYTQWMRNFGEDMFFYKQISITGKGDDYMLEEEETGEQTEEEMMIAGGRKEENYREKNLNEISMSVMPEGGHLIVGKKQRLAFKVVGNNGYGVDVNVKLVRQDGVVLAREKSKHIGMGFIYVTPSFKDTLTLVAESSGGLTCSAAIPQPLTSGVSMFVEQRKDQLIVHPLLTKDIETKHLACIVHGGCNFAIHLPVLRDTPACIERNELRTGVVSVMLVDTLRKAVLAERLAFVRGSGVVSSDIKMRMPKKGPKEPITLTIDLKSDDKLTMKGIYSLSVADHGVVKADTLQPMLESQILINSELRGYIENPNYYFTDITAKKDRMLDLLMMTQGWRRYNLGSILSGEKPEITHAVDSMQIISGSVRSVVGGSMRNVKLSLLSSAGEKIDVPLEGRKQFRLTDMDFVDGTTFQIQAYGPFNAQAFLELKIDTLDFPKLSNPFKNMPSSRFVKLAGGYSTQAKTQIMYASADKVIELDEVVKTAKRIHKSKGLISGEPPKGYAENDPQLEKFSSISSMIRMLGMRIMEIDDERKLYANTGLGIDKNNSVVVYLDNMRIDAEMLLNSISITDVKSVEYFPRHDTRLAIYGNDAVVGGLLLIYEKDGTTKKRTANPHAKAMVRQIGYREPVEFYSPQYPDADKSMYSRPDHRTTLYWNPKVRVGGDGTASVSFYSSDVSKEYLVTIEGITDNAKAVSRVAVVK